MPDDPKEPWEEELKAWFAHYGPPTPDPTLHFRRPVFAARAWAGRSDRRWGWAVAAAGLAALLLVAPRLLTRGPTRPVASSRQGAHWSIPGYAITVATLPASLPEDPLNWALLGPSRVVFVSPLPPYTVKTEALTGGPSHRLGTVSCSRKPLFPNFQSISGGIPVLFCPDAHPTVTAVLSRGGRTRLATYRIAAPPPSEGRGVFVLSGFEQGRQLIWWSISGNDGPGGRSGSGSLNLDTGAATAQPRWLHAIPGGGVFIGPGNGADYIVQGHRVYAWNGRRLAYRGFIPDLRIMAVGPHAAFWASVIPDPQNLSRERYVEEWPGRGVMRSWTIDQYVAASGPGWVVLEPDGPGTGPLQLRFLQSGRTLRWPEATGGPLYYQGGSGLLLIPARGTFQIVEIQPHP
jgi:hypothetical protein